MITNFFEFINEDLDTSYRMDHSAPVKDDNAPLYDMTMNGIYDVDIYSDNAKRLYDTGADYEGYSDQVVLNIIRTVRNKPNKLVKIYRSVPDINYEKNKEIKKYTDILNFQFKHRFFPPKNTIVDKIEEEIRKEIEGKGVSYDEFQKLVREKILTIENDLRNELEDKIRINSGVWIALTEEYAKFHALSNIKGKYKILTKTVKASQIFTDGNSIQEYSYIK